MLGGELRPRVRARALIAVPLACIGVVLVGAADALARNGNSLSYPLFWIGLIVVFLPIALAAVWDSTSRAERVFLVAVLGLLLYVVKILYSPTTIEFNDEFAHWRTAQDISASHGLFSGNQLIPVASVYPGLGAVTSVLSQATGLSITAAGMIVIAGARLVLMLAVFLLVERVTESHRIAVIASLVYVANPNFVYWSAQVAYESLALPLALFTLYVAAEQRAAHGRRRAALFVVSLLGMAAVLITHHSSMYALLAFLFIWLGITLRGRIRREPVAVPAGWMLPALGIAGTVLWVTFVAPSTVDYLVPVLSGAVGDLVRLDSGQSLPRTLFSSAGVVAPLWERALAFAAVGLLLIALPFGLVSGWRRWRRHAVAVVLLLAALAYPFTLPLRLTGLGQETSNRSTEFLFVGLGFGVALALIAAWKRPSATRALAAASALTVVFIGGTVVGWAFDLRLPVLDGGGGVPRLVGAQSLAAARWMREVVGPGHRIAADRTNALPLGSFAQEHTVSGPVDGTNVAPLFFSTSIDANDRTIVTVDRIQLVLVDWRLTQGLPPDIGIFYEEGERSGKAARPVPVAGFSKFAASDLSLLYDAGSIQIYDVSPLRAGS